MPADLDMLKRTPQKVSKALWNAHTMWRTEQGFHVLLYQLKRIPRHDKYRDLYTRWWINVGQWWDREHAVTIGNVYSGEDAWNGDVWLELVGIR